eukprot:2422854-Pyramimonas_sp.AAC.1
MASSERSGAALERFGGLMGPSGHALAAPRAVLGRVGSLLGPPLGPLVPSCTPRRPKSRRC